MVVKLIPPPLQPRTTNNMPGYRSKQFGHKQAVKRELAKLRAEVGELTDWCRGLHSETERTQAELNEERNRRTDMRRKTYDIDQRLKELEKTVSHVVTRLEREANQRNYKRKSMKGGSSAALFKGNGKWLEHVRAHQALHGGSWFESMRGASATYNRRR